MIQKITHIKVGMFDNLGMLVPLTPSALGNYKNLIYDLCQVS